MDAGLKSLLDFAANPPAPTPDPVLVAIEKLDQTVRESKDDPTPVIAAIQALLPALKAIPGAIKIPEPTEPLEAVSVTNLADVTKPLTDALTRLETAVKALEVAPKVDVAAPNVKVDAPDLSPLLRELANVEKAVKAIKFPDIPEPKEVDLSPTVKAVKETTKAIESLVFPTGSVTPTDPFVRFVLADIDAATAVIYLGYTDSLGGWYIKQMDTGASPMTVRLAFGNSNYSTNFANRAALSYAVWSQ